MESKLKCPFCGEDLDEDTLGDFCCINPECKESICFSGSKLLWQAFIQTKEELKDCQHNYSVKTEQHERGYVYATKTIKDLKSKLEIKRNALDLAFEMLKDIKNAPDINDELTQEIADRLSEIKVLTERGEE